MRVDLEFPEILQFLFWPQRFKVARGGRGGCKSWGFARALLIMGLDRTLRILCTREVQVSIKDSVHKLLRDQIDLLNLAGEYDVYDASIKNRHNGTEINFTGLSSHTVNTLKSYEGYDIAWIEEAQAITKRSLDILIPTIRKSGSEIWITYNPDLETDEIHQRFTVDPPPNCTNVEVNWRDNPWFNDVLEEARAECERKDPDNYPNIWEGKCKPAVEGAIYFKEIQAVEAQGRICNVPYDPMLRVHIVLDLGWGDSLAAGLVQKHLSEIRIIEYIEVNQTSLDIWSSMLRTRPYNWGKIWLPHDGFSAGLNSGGLSTFDILSALRWNVAEKDDTTILNNVGAGIRAVRPRFPQMYFDKTKCAAPVNHLGEPSMGMMPNQVQGYHPTKLNWRLIEILKRYRRAINRATDAEGLPVKDDYAHGADMLRYLACNVDNMTNEDDNLHIFIPAASYQPLDPGVGV